MPSASASGEGAFGGGAVSVPGRCSRADDAGGRAIAGGAGRPAEGGGTERDFTERAGIERVGAGPDSSRRSDGCVEGVSVSGRA